MGQGIFITVTLLLMLGILFLYGRKAALQMQYLRLKKKQKALPLSAFYRFRFSDKKARQERLEAFLLFPLMYPVVMDDSKEELLALKKRIKAIHIVIYFILVVLIILGIYSEKVFAKV